MSYLSVRRLLNRLLTDARFSADAAALIENVGRLEGHDLTEVELRLVAWINTCNFESVAGHLDSSLCRAGTPPKMPSHAGVGER